MEVYKIRRFPNVQSLRDIALHSTEPTPTGIHTECRLDSVLPQACVYLFRHVLEYVLAIAVATSVPLCRF